MLSSCLLRVARRSAASAPAATAARRSMAAAAAPSTAVSSTFNDGPPSVFDKIVKVTIIDPSGARRIIPAMVGQTLYEACDVNGVDLGPSSCGPAQEKVRSSTWTEPLYGEGAASGFDHVLLQGGNAGVDIVEPPHDNEKKMLEAYWDDDEIFPESRLASQVEINDKMDGMVVYVPDRIVDDIP
mmetsp:Transcript_1216/g.1667  ORF Transcript_1216/g.1667 Transcript_1216/m.1667 type:complete len:184 (-) Transcript_1216:187-738(-)|eukprot:CAMPEP_0201697106 /NCGR_PEP_ID=MMETSP0578-20130828/9508_1 /ASSEMBLY_ACC=CAM_ASM_000663 /TAXON_ID=267565 /ORGANISM="Skeletonema grethea, Strain CCMP 1804" /LENGTH=183 /DNA_ID=CAMNT_0048183185 /DNA_START=85 /DNA_END=636 /DNA_ORIENTATION=+